MLKLNKYITPGQDTLAVNFKKMSTALIYDEHIENGLILTEFYYSDEEKTDLVVQVDISYEYGADTLISKMVYNIKYIEENNEIGVTIDKVKIPTQRQKIKLLKKRRQTVRQNAEITTLGLMQQVITDKTVSEIMNIGGGFIVAHDQALDFYEKVGSPQIISDLTSATDYWLDLYPPALGGSVTIRQYLTGVFSA